VSVVWVIKYHDTPNELDDGEQLITGQWEPFAEGKGKMWFKRQIQSEHDEARSSTKEPRQEEDLAARFASEDNLP